MSKKKKYRGNHQRPNKFENEYNSLIVELELLKNKKIAKLKDKFSKKQPFKKGDIIYNVTGTGIIKIDSIDFKISYNGWSNK